MSDQPIEGAPQEQADGATPPLVTPEDLSDFPGAPFPASIVASVEADVRSEAGWHIAPQVAETIALDAEGGTLLSLPTLRLVEVLEVRDTRNPDTPKVITGWRKTTKGMLYNRGGWPDGFESVEVDIVHGYDACPAELVAVVAERCQYGAVNSVIGQEATGSESVSYRNEKTATPTRDRRVARYRVNWSV